MFLCGTPVRGAQYDFRSFKGDFGQHLRQLEERGISIAQPHRSLVEAIGAIEVTRTIELHHMPLLTREHFHLNFIQVYLQGSQSIFQDGSHQLIVCSSIRPFHIAQTGFFSF